MMRQLTKLQKARGNLSLLENFNRAEGLHPDYIPGKFASFSDVKVSKNY